MKYLNNRTLIGSAVRALLVALLFQLIIGACGIYFVSDAINREEEEGDRERLSRLKSSLKEEIVFQSIAGNHEAVEFVKYDLLLSENLVSVFIDKKERVRGWLDSEYPGNECDISLITEFCEIKNNATLVAIIPIKFRGQPTIYVVKSANVLRSAIQPENAILLVGGVLLLAFFSNLAGFILFYRKNVLTKIDSLISYIKEISGTTPPGPLQFRIEEYQKISSTLNEMWLGLNQANIDKLKSSEEKAIASMVQMLAHDVRKPFSMVAGMIDLFQTVEDGKKIKEMAGTFAPEIKRAIASVNSMLSDVMEVGANTQPNQEPTIPESLIESSLADVFLHQSDSDISIKYNFRHTSKIDVDPLKALRVFSNIIENALQAMNRKGKIWFATKNIQHSNSEYVEFTIGNSNSLISSGEIESLFEAFYTKNKTGGTGLGLAIASKIVKTHGGTIFCRSSEESGTEFVFTLPASEKSIYQPAISLPDHGDGFKSFVNQGGSTEAPEEKVAAESDYERRLLAALSKFDSKMEILIVDDEPIYRKLLAEKLSVSLELSSLIGISYATSSSETYIQYEKSDLSLIILDVDLGENSESGFEITKKLRNLGAACKICIHSNRGQFEYQKETLAAGANLFMSKPMSRSNLLQLLISVAEAKAVSGERLNYSDQEKPIIFLDDNILFQESWRTFRKIRVIVYQSPSEFNRALALDKNLLRNAACVVTDNYFENSQEQTGLEFAQSLKDRGWSLPIYLASDGEFSPAELGGAVDGIVSKNPLAAWAKISADINRL